MGFSTNRHRPDRQPTRQHRTRLGLLAATITAAACLPVVSTAQPAAAGAAWLDAVNTYRAASGLAPVVENAAWSQDATAHSCYMLQHGIGHSEQPGLAGYTPGGNEAAANGNVGTSGGIDPDTAFVDRWMSAPFHTIGLLRPGWTTTGFGSCSDPAGTAAKSAATLDVFRGLDNSVPVTSPVVFPGPGASVPMTSMSAEWPNPVELCGWTGEVGLPIVALMPADVSAADATLVGPDGPVETCVLHAGNVGDAYAQGLLASANAVIVVPRSPLAAGSHHVEISSDGGNHAWGFGAGGEASSTAQSLADTTLTGPPSSFEPIDPHRVVDTRIGLGATRLAAGQTIEVTVADSDAVAVSANITVIGPAAPGFLTVYDCAQERPMVSTVGYRAGEIVANQTTATVDAGRLCIYSLASVDIVMDLNGIYREGPGAKLQPVPPTRLLDSSIDLGGHIAPGQEYEIEVSGDTDVTGAIVNVTVVAPAGPGFVQVYPCGAPTTANISSLNFMRGEVRANAVVTGTGSAGTVCLKSSTATGVKVDLTALFTEAEGLEFAPVAALRMLDSRSTTPALNSGLGGSRLASGGIVAVPIAGVRGVPADTKAVTVNVTVTDATGPTFVTVFPCGTLPPTSNANMVPDQPATSNGVTVALSDAGEVCVYTLAAAHVIVDLNAVWQ